MSASQPENPNDLSERIISRDRASLLGNVTLAVSGQGAAFIGGLLAMIVTARLLGPDGYGRLAMFFLVLAVFSQVLVSWQNTGLVRFGREEMARSGRVRETFGAALLLFLVNLGVAAGIVFLFRERLGAYLNIGPAACLLLLIYLALNEAVQLFRALFQTISAFRAYAAAAFLIRPLNLVFIVCVFVLLAKPADAAGILKAHLASISVVLLMCAVVATRRPEAGVGVGGKKNVRRVAAYAWPLMLAGLWVLVVDWVDLALIRHYRPAVEVGWYAAAYQPLTVLGHLRIAGTAAVLPLLVSFAAAKRFATLEWSLDELLPQIAWATGIGGALAAAGVELIPLVLGAKYAPAVEPCRILMIAAACSCVAVFFEAMARAMDRVGMTVLVLAAVAATNVALDVVLIPRIGIAGGAVATSVAFGASLAVYLSCFNRIEELGRATARRVWIPLGIAPPIVCAIIASNLRNGPLRAACCLAVVAAALLAARTGRVFRRETLDKLQNVRMPDMARSALHRVYRIMDPSR